LSDRLRSDVTELFKKAKDVGAQGVYQALNDLVRCHSDPDPPGR
jgi:hypothetical protein